MAHTGVSGRAAGARLVQRTNPLGLEAIDHLECWVGNARQSAGFFAATLGFDITAYAGPETGLGDQASYLLEQGEVRLVVTGALAPESRIAAHHRIHGDGVHDIAFTVSSAAAAYETALERGAIGLRAPWVSEDETGKVVFASVATYGDTCHTFVERSAYSGSFLPGFRPYRSAPVGGPPVGLQVFDHVVANVELDSLSRWIGFYERVLGFKRLAGSDDEHFVNEYSALLSTIVWDGSRILLPINEPGKGRRNQVQEYLEHYRSPGVQHIAVQTGDLFSSVRALRERGLHFPSVPGAYYRAAAGHRARASLGRAR